MSLRQHSINATQLQPYLLDCGYDQSRLAFDIELDLPRRIPIVAFAHSPKDSRSACIAVIDNIAEPQREVAACWGIGAPLVFAPFENQWQLWKQATQRPQLIESIAPSELASFFSQHRSALGPISVYRAKTWARFDKNYQLDFVDAGLMPLVEEEAGQKLSGLIERVVTTTKSRLHWHEISDEQGHWLLKSSFWLLAGKILKDKRVPTFDGLELEDLEDVFSRVAKHYGASTPVSVGSILQANSLRDAASEISRFSSLGLVTTEALAYLYENALITKETRTQLGTHSTPTYLVDYIVGKLRPWFEGMPSEERQIFEPACGHAAFLLAGMRMLGDLLPADTSANSRHDYLRARLHGCDIDSFALEIARLSLTLSDVPNPNGWDLKSADMFHDDLLETYLTKATIVLANPPFKDARRLLHQVVERLLPGAIFGVVLPRGLLHSAGATAIRQGLSRDFEIAEICVFPDQVFAFSSAESAVILARRLRSNSRSTRPTLYRRVRERDFAGFRHLYDSTEDLEISPTNFSETNGWNFEVPELAELWEFCKALPSFADVATIGKGFDLRSVEDPDFVPNTIRFSTTPVESFIEAFLRLTAGLKTHQLPKSSWVNPDVIKTPRHGTTTGIPQVLLNYSPVSRGPWRLKALLDRVGHAVNSCFLAVRPKDNRWPLEALWGLCNSPFANGYSYAFSTKRVLAGVIRNMPVPDLGSKDLTPLVSAVRAYLDHNTLLSSVDPNDLRLMHWRIDAEVLRLYELPVRLERELVNLFSGRRRRGVPFVQRDYFPQHFREAIALHELLAITADWNEINQRREELILKNVKETVSSAERLELGNLQRLADMRVRMLAPLPLKQMERIRDELYQRGIWEGADARS
jgi:hypothetical protein